MNAQRQAARAKAHAGRFPGAAQGWAGTGAPGSSPALTAGRRGEMAEGKPEQLRHLTAIVLHHPDLVHDVEEAWCSLTLPEDQHRLRHAILSWSEHADTLESTALLAHLIHSGFAEDVARVTAPVPNRLTAAALPDAMPAEAEAAWWGYFGQLHRPELEREVAAAQKAMAESLTEATQRRLATLAAALNKLRYDDQGEESAF